MHSRKRPTNDSVSTPGKPKTPKLAALPNFPCPYGEIEGSLGTKLKIPHIVHLMGARPMGVLIGVYYGRVPMGLHLMGIYLTGLTGLHVMSVYTCISRTCVLCVCLIGACLMGHAPHGHAPHWHAPHGYASYVCAPHGHASHGHTPHCMRLIGMYFTGIPHRAGSLVKKSCYLVPACEPTLLSATIEPSCTSFPTPEWAFFASVGILKNLLLHVLGLWPVPCECLS